MTTIVFTGGGSAGHVTPNLALIDSLNGLAWKIEYIGERNGVEQTIAENHSVHFNPIFCGKLRRYFSWKNFIDPFKIMIGIIQSYYLLHRLKADIVFSKGGFVAFPVVFAAWLKRIPIVAHESDLTPGLANRLCFPFVNKICLTFAGAEKFFNKSQATVVTGTPLREQLYTGCAKKALELCGFSGEKSCLLIIGGGQGSAEINQALRANIETLRQDFHIIHLCGSGKLSNELIGVKDYVQQEYATNELPHYYALADVVISRAGANTLYELLALEKPHILIPLSAKVSRGDQVENAAYFEQLGISRVIASADLTPSMLYSAINTLKRDKESIVSKLKALNIKPANKQIIAIIKEYVHAKSRKNSKVL